MLDELDEKFDMVMGCFEGHATDQQLDQRRGAKFRKAFHEELGEFTTEILTKAARKVRKLGALNSSHNLWALIRAECEKLIPPERTAGKSQRGCAFCSDGVVFVDDEPNLVVACPVCDHGSRFDAATMRDRGSMANIAGRSKRAEEKVHVRATLTRIVAAAERAGVPVWWRPAGDHGAPRPPLTPLRDAASAAANDRTLDEVDSVDSAQAEDGNAF